MFHARSFDIAFCATIIAVGSIAFAQTESATITGRVTDASNAVLNGADVEIRSVEHGTAAKTVTNGSGIYFFPAVQPGQYNITVRREGFRRVDALGLTVNVQDHVVENFELQVGSAVESVTVNAEAPLINIQDGTVSTVIDRNFAENLPMNGRSFQSLIELTPGVVAIPTNINDGGQFSVNGQRGSSNYWAVDGVSANIAVNAQADGTPGQGFGGALGGTTAQGGTSGLVSIDAMQEFRIDTSTFAPEYGRTPGAQIAILTRSGANQFNGEIFDYFRNDVLGANDWFADRNHLPKPEDRQNDFGGTFSGPIFKDKTFFFFSYEGLRLRLPQVGTSTVPDLHARQSANTPLLRAILNAFPSPTPGLPDDPATGVAGFKASYSNKSRLDASSLRLDHILNQRLHLFGRYDYSPSDLSIRSGPNGAFIFSNLKPSAVDIQTATAGASWLLSPNIETDVRLNYSRTAALGTASVDGFGGANPLPSLPVPAPYTTKNSQVIVGVFGLENAFFEVGRTAANTQKQINFIDGWSAQRGSHSLKWGIDYRRLTPSFDPAGYTQFIDFANVAAVETGTTFFQGIQSSSNGTLLLRTLGLFAQDNWRLGRLSLMYGLRWDGDFSPSSVQGPSLLAVNNFNLLNPAQITIARRGTPPFNSRYTNFAPRVGVAYELRHDPVWPTVLRGGFGVFYDLATAEVGNFVQNNQYPFGASIFHFGNTAYPLTPDQAAPIPILPPSPMVPNSVLAAFDPNLKSPYTLQWNTAIEQGLGTHQSLSTTYVGARGRELVGSTLILNIPQAPNGGSFVTNGGTSDYDALQLQFQRRLSRGLQVLSSYSWGHSIDTGSSSSLFYGSLIPGAPARQDRGPSNWDIRNAFSAGVTYNMPTLSTRSNFLNRLVGEWSVQSIIQARSAPPVNLIDLSLGTLNNVISSALRPDVVPGQPFYLFGSQYPGGKAFNPSAFTPPPVDASFNVLRQGDIARNALRGFGAAQWDFGVHRVFPIREAVKLEFRAELFNILNHPNFGPPINDISNPNFGLSTQMLGAFLDQNAGGGSFISAYQFGGPRTVQLALKLIF